VADVVPARELGWEPQDARADLLRHPQHTLPVRALRDRRAGALRPAARSVRPAQRGELAAQRAEMLRECHPPPPGYKLP
jgi:hypothetical protein